MMHANNRRYAENDKNNKDGVCIIKKYASEKFNFISWHMYGRSHKHVMDILLNKATKVMALRGVGPLDDFVAAPKEDDSRTICTFYGENVQYVWDKYDDKIHMKKSLHQSQILHRYFLHTDPENEKKNLSFICRKRATDVIVLESEKQKIPMFCLVFGSMHFFNCHADHDDVDIEDILSTIKNCIESTDSWILMSTFNINATRFMEKYSSRYTVINWSPKTHNYAIVSNTDTRWLYVRAFTQFMELDKSYPLFYRDNGETSALFQ